MKHLFLRTLVFSCLLFTLSNVDAQVQTPRYASIAGNSKAYYEYLPEGYGSGSQTYPLLIFIHGLGEQGAGTSSTLPAVLRNGIPKLINEGTFPRSFTVNGQTHRFIAISPQFSSWPKPADVQAVLDYMVSHYRVNTGRIYMTGLSMGGGATWEYAGNNSTYANRLAAIVPICGASWPDMTRSKNMGNSDLPVWATHNSGDPTAPVSYTVDYVNNINTVSPSPLARKTIFNVGGHDAWSTTYNPSYKENNMNIYEWMLQYQRGAGAPLPNRPPGANAGADKVLTLPSNSAALSGSGTDTDGSITKYSWTKTSGPSQFTISNSAISNPTVSNLVAGTYVLRLTVTDNGNATGYDEMSIRVDATQQPPAGTKSIPGIIEAEDYDAMYLIKVEKTKDAGGGSNIAGVHKRDWMDYNVSVAAAGTYTVNLRVASFVNTAQLQILNGSSVLTTVNVPNTGGYQTWRTVSTTVSLQAGAQTLRVYSSSAGAWFLNWMQFSSGTGTAAAGIVQQSGITETDASLNSARPQTLDVNSKESLGMYPNPVADQFTLQLNNAFTGMMSVQIVDLTGRIRKEFRVAKNQSSTQYNLAADGLSPGIYFIKLQLGTWKNTLKMLKR